MAQGVHPSVEATEPALAEPSVDRVLTEAKGDQLSSRCNPMLTSHQPRQLTIRWGEFVVYRL